MPSDKEDVPPKLVGGIKATPIIKGYWFPTVIAYSWEKFSSQKLVRCARTLPGSYSPAPSETADTETSNDISNIIQIKAAKESPEQLMGVANSKRQDSS